MAVNRLFHAALEVSPAERQGFVATASEGDPELRAEVELLLQADAEAGSYIEQPLLPLDLLGDPAPPLAAGDVLCGRFRIVRAIAEGGMGHVYEAFDSELAVHVALKVIRPEIASDPEALARFRQEVRLARRITHPNVCRTYDLERETRSGPTCDLLFLTMEYLEGETLAAKIERTGALPLEEALEIARQVAAALEAARSLGIVHRDMKPANVMMVAEQTGQTGGFRAVITDFGLARLDPLLAAGNASALSHTARPIGTLAYMAPEQLQGAQVSAATDVYAFGLILFEMVTGRRAFPSGNFLSGIAQRLTGAAPDPQTLVPTLPEPWRRAIAGCLRTEPSERFTSAADAVAVLNGGRVRLPRPSRAAGRGRLSRSGLAWIAVAVLAAVALFAGAFRFYQSRTNAKVAPGALVYLAPMENRTSEKALDNLPELLRAGLSQSAQVNLLDQGQVGDILQQMTRPPNSAIDAATAREIAMRAGAVRVVFATASGGAGNYKLNIDIEQPDNTPGRYRNHWTKSFSWAQGPANPASADRIPPELLTAVRNASDWIRQQAGESANDIARLDVPPEDVTTRSWQALTDYSDADRLALEHRADAVVLLEQAVKTDPQFALAYARMGDLLFALNRTEEGYSAYSRALDDDLASRLTRRERDFIKGTFAADTRDFASAAEAFRDCAIYYESDALCVFFEAHPLRMMGRSREALDALQRAIEIAPDFTGAYQSEAYDYILLGDYRGAGGAIDRLRQAGHADQATLLAGNLAFLRHDVAAAETAFAGLTSRQVDQDWSIGYALLARLAAERGQYRLALQYLGQGIDAAKAHEDRESVAARLFDRAYIEAREGDVTACLSDNAAGLNLDGSPAAILRASAAFGYLAATKPASATLLAERLAALESMIPASGSGTIFDLTRSRVHGEVLLARGEPEEALTQFKKADNLDAAITDREYLARALAALAAKQQSAGTAQALRAEALSAYERIALRPGAVWFCPEWSPPGFFADEVEDALRLAQKMPAHSDVLQLTRQYSWLRFSSSRAMGALAR